jgi:hypothetical protein
MTSAAERLPRARLNPILVTVVLLGGALVWRARLPLGEQVTVHDELDLWGCYLMCERFGMLADGAHLKLANSTTDLDAYYDGLMGRGPKRRRPGKFLQEPARTFVDRMATDRPEGLAFSGGRVPRPVDP